MTEIPLSFYTFLGKNVIKIISACRFMRKIWFPIFFCDGDYYVVSIVNQSGYKAHDKISCKQPLFLDLDPNKRNDLYHQFPFFYSDLNDHLNHSNSKKHLIIRATGKLGNIVNHTFNINGHNFLKPLIFPRSQIIHQFNMIKDPKNGIKYVHLLLISFYDKKHMKTLVINIVSGDSRVIKSLPNI